jgi:ATP-binding cassette subfamily F protein 3
LLQINKGSKQYGPKILFDEVTLAINEGEHVGVIGPNGAGKTTLFKVLVGQESLDSGQVIKAQGLRIGYLEQESEWSLDLSSEEYLEQNCTKPIWDLKQIGKTLGLFEEHFQAPLRSLSGGYRMRMKLLYLIGVEPHLMLLDEPTNFLDLESILALENFLQGYRGAFLLISHDREFLRRTTESTLEVEAGDITKFPGNIDDYFEQKAQLRGILEAQAANNDAKRKQVQDFVDRFGAKATKARQAQSRIKQLEKMEVIEVKPLAVRARIQIPEPIHTGKEILSYQNASFGYPNKTVLTEVNLRLERGSRVGVVGFNGAGKSTLLKTLAGRLPALVGEGKLGYQVTLSYFAQHVAEELDMKDSVLDCLQKAAHRDIKAQEILNLAGSLLFSGGDVDKKVRVLSGGEKARVALGQMLLKKSPLLIMDEPTNHLDFDTVEALTNALAHFAGTLIVVSHDRSFIRRVSNKILEIRDGHAEVYPGTYDDYVWSLEKGALKDRSMDSAASPKAAKFHDGPSALVNSPKINFKEQSKLLQNEIKDFEKRIRKAEEFLLSLEQKRDELTQNLISAQGLAAKELAKDLGLCAKEIEKTEENLLEFMESLDQKENALKELKGNS